MATKNKHFLILIYNSNNTVTIYLYTRKKNIPKRNADHVKKPHKIFAYTLRTHEQQQFVGINNKKTLTLENI